MSDRYIKRDGYSIIVQETDSTEEINEMVSHMFTAVKAAPSEEESVQDLLSQHEGLEFVCVTYYESFIAPSMMRGFAILILFPVPDEDVTDEQRERLGVLLPEEIAQKALMVASPTNPAFISYALEEEMNHIAKSRVKLLQSF